MISFTDVASCPDIMLGRGQWLTLRFSFVRNGQLLQKSTSEILTLRISLKALCLFKQDNLQRAAARNYPGTAPPMFVDITAVIAHGHPARLLVGCGAHRCRHRHVFGVMI